jgi:two-component system chemotaxis response regulator CheY
MPHTILYVEDYEVVATAVKESLEIEGWCVVRCVDGADALQHLVSPVPYDLLLTDNHLPKLDGLALVRYTRQLQHRATLPILMFSAVDCAGTAYRSGGDVFLKKPEDSDLLVSTVARLLLEHA